MIFGIWFSKISFLNLSAKLQLHLAVLVKKHIYLNLKVYLSISTWNTNARFNRGNLSQNILHWVLIWHTASVVIQLGKSKTTKHTLSMCILRPLWFDIIVPSEMCVRIFYSNCQANLTQLVLKIKHWTQVPCKNLFLKYT